ncbi:MAG: PIG-L family deacetylase [Anaerolineae bacterium]|nr:MAG: PIG-L family deacetylase [Anaerolineae bacterium]
MNHPPTILTFFAHPDDETMLAGGTLALLAQSGCTVHYLCATRGEGGETGEPPLCPQSALGDLREQEMVCAVQALGGRSLTFLGYTDPLVSEDGTLHPYTDDLTTLAGQVAASIRQYQPHALITHGVNGEYGHPAHVLTWQAAWVAVQSLGKDAPALYTVSAAFEAHPRPRLANPDHPAHFVIDVRDTLERKTQAALCHRSQHALFTRRSSKEAGRQLSVPEVVARLNLESLHRAAPANLPLDDPLAQWLQHLPQVQVHAP